MIDAVIMVALIAVYFDIPTYSYEFPLKHPKYIVKDRMYYKAVRKKFDMSFCDYVEDKVRRIIFSDKGEIIKMIKKKLHK